MKKLFLFLTLVIVIIWLFQQDWVSRVFDEELFIEEIQEAVSYEVLWVTLPLHILQGVVTIFPFITLLIVHLLVFGFWEALVFSWIGSMLGSIVCFYLGRFFFHDYFQKIWQKNYTRYQKWIQWADQYGMWGLILLRHIPVLPSNLISLIGAFSPIRQGTYIWSSILGNLSMVWLYSLFSYGVSLPSGFSFYLWGYIVFVGILAAACFLHIKHWPRSKKHPHSEDKTFQH